MASEPIRPDDPVAIEAYLRQSISRADWYRRADEIRVKNGGDYPAGYVEIVTAPRLKAFHDNLD